MSLLLILPLLSFGCRDFDDRVGSSGLAEGPDVDVTGTWEGTWITTNGSPDGGAVRFEIEQEDDGTVFGRSFWVGSPCWDDGRGVFDGQGEAFDGSISGSTMPSPVLMEIPRDPRGTSPRIQAMRVTGRLDIVVDRMTGTFEVVAEDRNAASNPARNRCTDGVARIGDRGTLRLTR
ncbi:MAG: hypothetical protein GY944_30105 [bacterium]|nr:hypothetical protein [bacterium]